VTYKREKTSSILSEVQAKKKGQGTKKYLAKGAQERKTASSTIAQSEKKHLMLKGGVTRIWSQGGNG